jgi:hypothetical protein
MSELSHVIFYKLVLLSNRNMIKGRSTVSSFKIGSLRDRSWWVDGQRMIVKSEKS